jgi:hypothetical protein
MFRYAAILAIGVAMAASPSIAETVYVKAVVNGVKLTLAIEPDDLKVAPVEPSYSSFWEFNGSQMGLQTEGNARRFYYIEPRDGLAELGVRAGELHFDGRREGSRYTGQARVFTKNCGAQPYDVTGIVAPDDRSVTLVGWAPVLDATCAVVNHKELVNVYNLR